MVPREGEPFLETDVERAGVRAAFHRMELLRPHHQEAGEHCDVARCIDGEADARTRGGDDDPAECRAEDARAVEDPGVEADCIGQLEWADHAEGQLLTGRRVEDLHASHQRRDHVDVPGAGDSR